MKFYLLLVNNFGEMLEEYFATEINPLEILNITQNPNRKVLILNRKRKLIDWYRGNSNLFPEIPKDRLK